MKFAKCARHMTAALLTGVMAIGFLVGCTGGTPGSTPPSAPVAGNENEASSSAGANADPGTLVLYAATPEDQLIPTVEGFERATGIKVEVVAAGTGELYKRIEAEGDNPLGDVMLGGMVSSGFTPKLDLWDEYVSPNDEFLPPQFQNTTGKITSLNMVPSVIMVNNDLIGDIEITGYEDLLNPALRGKITMPDPSQTSSGWEQLINMLWAMGNGDTEEGWAYVEELMNNVDGKILQSSSAVHKGVADGEYAVGLVAEGMVDIYTEEGLNVSKIFMSEGVVVNVDGVAIIKGAKNRENAEKFIDYLISQEYQTDLLSFSPPRRPIRTDIEGETSLTPTSEINQIIVDMDYISANKAAMLDKFKDLATNYA